ncbi:S41 family peptidase [Altererythrobacter litoralis]|uniref:S41 family peptidase n=1 Tax=Altererythrobacter litoralis TaxID=3113904 RepID=A0ABU7GD52_9SPHN|nr:S41 family peptidase [Erythrobacteraceae bacterium 1XM1-14]
MGIVRSALSATLAFSLAACGGGGSSSPPPTGGGATPTPTACSLTSRQQWVKSVLDEWYLFPELLSANVNGAAYSDLQSYIDALVAPARAQSKDRYFTYITSIAEENALINSGSSAGFGIRLGYDTSANRVFVLEAYENAPGLGAGIDRGTELLAIGTNSSNLQSVSTLMATGGPQAVIDALGPSDPGVTRVIRFRTASGVTIEASIAKADYSLDPVSDRYGVRIIDDGGKKVGYLNLRTFIVSSADPDLRAAFQQFKDQGVTELIIDFRYNSGGLVSIGNLMGDLMGAGRAGQVWSKTILRSSKSSENETKLFASQSQAIAPTKVAFIGRGGTASASELVINSMLPYLGNNVALIGTNTYGKPVGQFGFDRDECDDRLRAVTFKTVNANDQGEYFTGLASVMPNTCRANDDIFVPLGDPREASIATALDFLAGRSCTSISEAGLRTTQAVSGERQLMQPERPTAAQHQIPGLF